VAAGGDPGDWLGQARQPEALRAIEAATDEAEAAGVFGVPSMVIRGELFWGLDSLPVLEWRLTESRG
jgi:2-hydroxychromene-2-carboxylate isomerase